MKKNIPLRLASVFFFCLIHFDVLALALGYENIARFIKPLLVPSLALVAAMYFRVHKAPRKSIVLLFLALAFHTAGDVILEFGNFFVGAGAFLTGHFFYLAIILKFVNLYEGLKKGWFIALPLFIAPFLTVCLLGLEFPISAIISVYAYTLMMLPLCGLAGWLKKEQHAWKIFAGGLLFLISDAILGLNVFRGVDFAFRHSVVMGTYLGAQTLLVYGIAHNITMTEKNI